MIKNALKCALKNSELSLKYGSDMTGFSKTELSEYRNGKRSISLEKALKVAQGFSVQDDFIKYLYRAMVDKCTETRQERKEYPSV
jgi:transcriptional regulator with XRE-family HTH domain